MANPDDMAKVGPGAEIFGGDLTEADLRGADLENANLTGAQYSDDTTWSDGFDPAHAGAVKI